MNSLGYPGGMLMICGSLAARTGVLSHRTRWPRVLGVAEKLGQCPEEPQEAVIGHPPSL